MKQSQIPLRIAAILLGAIFVVSLGAHEWIHRADGSTHLSFLDVGQGDSTLVRSPSGKTILIDGGPDLTTLEHLGSHLPFFDRDIDLLILSHPHQDHLASFLEILKRYHVKKILLAKTPFELPRYKGILDELRTQNISVVFAEAGQKLGYNDGLTFDVLWPTAGLENDDVNNASVVVRMRKDAHSALFTGDAEEPTEDALIASQVDLHAELLKVGHHGSNTSSSTGFILAIHPSQAVISVGVGNSYGHPNAEILQRYANFHIPVWRTDQQGTMEIVWK